MGTALVMAAGGSGTRVGAATPKQLLLIHDRPVLWWSLQPFLGLVDCVVIAASQITADALSVWQEDPTLAQGMPSDLHVVPGGHDRQASVCAALQAVPEACTRVLVHDAARPLVTREIIQASIDALDGHQACVVAVQSHATVKQSTDGHTVAATIPREEIWLAQTPQGFHRDIGLAAFAAAEASGQRYSDDAGLLEAHGHSVALVPGASHNLKITTADDLTLAAALLHA